MTAYPLNETSWLSSVKPVENVQLPAFYRTQFMLSENYTTCLDTYLDTSGWTKVCSIKIDSLKCHKLVFKYVILYF
jgi:hypothetical protein